MHICVIVTEKSWNATVTHQTTLLRAFKLTALNTEKHCRESTVLRAGALIPVTGSLPEQTWLLIQMRDSTEWIAPHLHHFLTPKAHTFASSSFHAQHDMLWGLIECHLLSQFKVFLQFKGSTWDTKLKSGWAPQKDKLGWESSRNIPHWSASLSAWG